MPGSVTGQGGQDDFVQPFQIERVSVRGRVARLGALVTDVLTRHDYPEPVSLLLGEALTLTALFGSTLKFDGKLTFQAQGKGPIAMLVADYRSPGTLRGYAHIDQDRLAEMIKAGKTSLRDLMGDGFLAMTIDQGTHTERYQGIVALDPEGLTHSAHEYFERSEQIATRIRLAVGPIYNRDASGQSQTSWRAGAIMIQHLARDGGLTGAREDQAEEDKTKPPSLEEENWSHASIMLGSVEDHELLDPALSADRLLYRLYHEDGVRVFEGTPLTFGCSCSRERSANVLGSFDETDIEGMVENGQISVTCEFCNQVYAFDPDDIIVSSS